MMKYCPELSVEALLAYPKDCWNEVESQLSIFLLFGAVLCPKELYQQMCYSHLGVFKRELSISAGYMTF